MTSTLSLECGGRPVGGRSCPSLPSLPLSRFLSLFPPATQSHTLTASRRDLAQGQQAPPCLPVTGSGAPGGWPSVLCCSCHRPSSHTCSHSFPAAPAHAAAGRDPEKDILQMSQTSMASSGRSFRAHLGPPPQGRALEDPFQLYACLEVTLTESLSLSGFQGPAGMDGGLTSGLRCELAGPCRDYGVPGRAHCPPWGLHMGLWGPAIAGPLLGVRALSGAG